MRFDLTIQLLLSMACYGLCYGFVLSATHVVKDNVKAILQKDHYAFHPYAEFGNGLRNLERKLVDDLSSAVYKYVTSNHRVPEVSRIVVCFENGECVDIGDVGVHPYV